MNSSNNITITCSGFGKGAGPAPKPQQAARADLYNNYNHDMTETDPTLAFGHHIPSLNPRGDHSQYKHSSPGRDVDGSGHWDLSDSDAGGRYLEGHGVIPETAVRQRTHFYGASAETVDADYTSIRRRGDRQSSSPETQVPVEPYGGHRTSRSQREFSREHKREVRLSPSGLQEDQLRYVGTGEDQIAPSHTTEMVKKKNRSVIIEKNPFTCELCDIEMASKHELEGHLESKSHWDTMEHIQQKNSYDDLTIAFLQEVLQFKVRHCCQALEEHRVQELQETDHMTRVEMFHCAACKVYVSTSASSVESHLSSEEHVWNRQEFEMRQRRACLEKAESVMKKLKAQFALFHQGGDPFE